MHDGAVVIGAEVVASGNGLVEIRCFCGIDIRKVDNDKRVPVFAGVLVEKADRVAEFMDRSSGAAIDPECNRLARNMHVSDVGGARAGVGRVHKANVIGFAITGADDDGVGQLGVPVGNGVGDAVLAGQRRINLIGHDAGSPPVVGAGNPHALALSVLLFTGYGLDLLRGAEDHVAFK